METRVTALIQTKNSLQDELAEAQEQIQSLAYEQPPVAVLITKNPSK